MTVPTDVVWTVWPLGVHHQAGHAETPWRAAHHSGPAGDRLWRAGHRPQRLPHSGRVHWRIWWVAVTYIWPIVLSLEKGVYPENVHAVYCRIKSTFVLIFYVFGSRFGILALFRFSMGWTQRQHCLYTVTRVELAANASMPLFFLISLNSTTKTYFSFSFFRTGKTDCCEDYVAHTIRMWFHEVPGR